MYGMGRRAVERKFDTHRWVDPVRYISFKRDTRKQVDELSALASDHLERIEELQLAIATSNAAKEASESKLQEQERSYISLAKREKELSDKQVSDREAFVDLVGKYERYKLHYDNSIDLLRHIDIVLNKLLIYTEENRQPSGKSIGSGLLKVMRPGQEEEMASEIQSLKSAIKRISGV